MLAETDGLALKAIIRCLEGTLLKHENLEILKEKDGEIYEIYLTNSNHREL